MSNSQASYEGTKAAPRIPIHPQPFPDESQESWLTRLAFANTYTLRTFINRYVIPHQSLNWPIVDLDFTDLNQPVQSNLCLERSPAPLSMLSYIGRLGENVQDLYDWATPSRGSRRYCPQCLASDKVPYFRLAWRLLLLPICLRHGAFLRDSCESCGTDANFQMWRTHLRPIGKLLWFPSSLVSRV
jgi:hypothetical protein